MYFYFQKTPCDEPPDLADLASPWEEHFGVRFLVHCRKLLFKLNSELEPVRKSSCLFSGLLGSMISEEIFQLNFFFQIEPYFTSLALYDARNGIKLSEDFHFSLNPPEVMDMLAIEKPHGSPTSELLPYLKDAPPITKVYFCLHLIPPPCLK